MMSDSSHEYDMNAQNQRHESSRTVSGGSIPPHMLKKPRGFIQERSSSHGVRTSSAPAVDKARIPMDTHVKDQSGTYRSAKSNKEEGHKVRSLLRLCSIQAEPFRL